MRKSILAVLFLVFCPLLAAQQALNNDAVIKLVKAGVSDDLIVSAINVHPGVFDVSVTALKVLKDSGVSDKVVSAMVTKNNTPESGKAVIYVYRLGKLLGAANYWLLYADKAYVGKMLNSNYVRVEAAPGTVVFSQLHQMHDVTLLWALGNMVEKDVKEIDRFQVEAGKTYYIRWTLHMTGPKMELMDQDQGEKEMSSCHPNKEVAPEEK